VYGGGINFLHYLSIWSTSKPTKTDRSCDLYQTSFLPALYGFNLSGGTVVVVIEWDVTSLSVFETVGCGVLSLIERGRSGKTSGRLWGLHKTSFLSDAVPESFFHRTNPPTTLHTPNLPIFRSCNLPIDRNEPRTNRLTRLSSSPLPINATPPVSSYRVKQTPPIT
jgi:hypothetical protein